MKLFKKLSLTLTGFLATMSLVGCGAVESVGGMAGYHKIAASEVTINSKVYEEYADLVEIKFYESKDGEIGDPITAEKTYVRAGRDIIMTIGAIDTLALDGEVTCDIKTVKLIDRKELVEEPAETPSSEEVKPEVKEAKESEEVKEALPIIAEYVFEMPDSTPTFILKFTGTLPHVHEFSEAWVSTELGHYHLCGCGLKTDIEEHTFDEGTVTKEATETEKGTKVYKCTVCKYEKTEEFVYVPEVTTEETPTTSAE